MNFWIKLLVMWNFVSVVLLLMSVTLSETVSGSTNEDINEEVLPAKAHEDGATQLENTTSTQTNQSDETSSFKVANCTVNETVVCGNGDVECSALSGYCIDCEFNHSCPYGSRQKALCRPKPTVSCLGDREFERDYECRYCYQLPRDFYVCAPNTYCALNKPRSHYPARPQHISTCWTQEQHLCLGRRCFSKQRPCNWSNGYKWSTAMLLSIFLGGFGFDRFYLGLWQDGIGKLLSFGGLGVWTLVDVILIAVGYIGPWDGSLYI